jgi:hypothetical protein
MGSSAFREPGPYGAGHAVLQARVPCAPCAHDPACLIATDGYPCTHVIEPAEAAAVAASLVTGTAPAPPPSPLHGLYVSERDPWGLVTYRAAGDRTASDVCIEVFRWHLLEGLTGVRKPLSMELPPSSARALAQLRDVVRGLLAKHRGEGADRLTGTLRLLEEPFAIAMSRVGAERITEGDDHIAADLGLLERRLSEALAQATTA